MGVSTRQQAHDINSSNLSVGSGYQQLPIAPEVHSFQSAPVAIPQRDVNEAARDAGPTCTVDSTTDIPQDLFDTLLKRGKERRKAGQHVLVARSQKSGGGVKLVAAERVA